MIGRLTRIRRAMLNLAKVIHEAFGIDSPRVFIVVFALIGFVIFGGLGWLVDQAYRVKLREDAAATRKLEPPVPLAYSVQ